MIPGHPTHTSYRTIALEDFGVPMCATRDGCSKGLGSRAHTDGRVDRAGTIHWVAADRRASKKGMRQLLKLMAMAYNRSYWTEPKWKQLYLTNVWAYKEAQRRYHMRIRAEWSAHDRQVALTLIQRSGKRVGSLRRRHRNVYVWLWNAGLTGRGVVRYASTQVTTD